MLDSILTMFGFGFYYFGILGFGFWIYSFGFWILDSGFQINKNEKIYLKIGSLSLSYIYIRIFINIIISANWLRYIVGFSRKKQDIHQLENAFTNFLTHCKQDISRHWTEMWRENNRRKEWNCLYIIKEREREREVEKQREREREK